MRPIDADALIEFCAERWIPLNIDAVNMQPTIQPEKAQLSCEGTTSDTISRQWLLECVDEGWIKFDTEKDANRFIHLVRDIAPTAQPVVTDTNVGDIISRQAAIDALNEHGALYCDNTPETFSKLSYVEKSRVDELDTAIATLVNLPPAQPEHKVRFADKDHVWIDGKQYISLPRFQEAVKEAQPKEGHWIEVAGELECSECHTVFTDLYPDYADSVACPHCGAKMTISTK